MKRMIIALALVAGFAGVGDLGAQEFQLVVNAANPTTEIGTAEASLIFKKKARSFSHGEAAQPVDLPKNSPIREQFSQAVHGRSAGQIASFWQQQIFSGRDVPPIEKSTDAAVLEFVRSNPGAIGYVSAGAVVRDGVKTINVTG